MKTINNKKKSNTTLDYFIKTLNGMALGLFSTLIIGTILQTIGNLLNIKHLIELAKIIQGLLGVGIGIGVATSLNLAGLKLIVASLTGGIAAGLAPYVGQTIAPLIIGKALVFKADPIVIYFTVILSLGIMNFLLKKKTPIDIILIPLIGTISAFLVASVITLPITTAINWIGKFIIVSTNATPFFMGIIISVVMGMALTAPISSAAIAIAIHLGTDAVKYGLTQAEALSLGIAGGAALTGCCVQMLGFAVMSRKDNNIGGVISVGIGTSMLQFKNIVKKPIIWLPTIIVSAILGPVSTVVFKMKTTSIGSGMGTSGLVGQIATIDSMGNNLNTILIIIVLQILLPIILVYIVDVIFRKRGLIIKGDLKL